MTFETLCLPDWYVDRVDTVANASKKTRQNHLDSLGGGCLKYGTDHHNPGTPFDATLAAKAVRSKESNDCPNKAAYVVDAGDNAFGASIGIIELCSKGWKAYDRSQNPLIISEKLHGQSQIQRTARR